VTLPLAGVTVVSCEQAVAAPMATRHLADLGARVIKIERPGDGDFARDYDEKVRGMSSHFVWLNRSKESIALDLKDPSSREVMTRLLDRADIFVQNFAPGAAERLDLGASHIRRGRKRLITCSISGYGPNGPYSQSKAYDLLIQSESGLLTLTGTERDPAKCGIPVADISAGMYAFSGILTALYNRERSGEGAELQVSMFDCLLEWMGYPLYYTQYGGTPPKRAGTSHASIAPYGTFNVGDGSAMSSCSATTWPTTTGSPQCRAETPTVSCSSPRSSGSSRPCQARRSRTDCRAPLSPTPAGVMWVRFCNTRNSVLVTAGRTSTRP